MEVYFSVINDHVLKVLNFSCLSQKIVSRTLIERLRAILTPFLESTQILYDENIGRNFLVQKVDV